MRGWMEPHAGHPLKLSGDGGATVLEFLIVALLLSLLFASIIEFSVLMARMMTMSQGLRSTARSTIVETAECTEKAEAVFQGEMQRIWVGLNEVELSSEVDDGTLTLHVEAEIPCRFCRLFVRGDYRSSYSVSLPLENEGEC